MKREVRVASAGQKKASEVTFEDNGLGGGGGITCKSKQIKELEVADVLTK